MRIKIDRTGRVTIITPLGFPKSKAIAFFYEKIELVKKHLKSRTVQNSVFAFSDGAQFYLFGDIVELKIEKSIKTGYVLDGNQFILKVKTCDKSTIKNSFFKK